MTPILVLMQKLSVAYGYRPEDHKLVWTKRAREKIKELIWQLAEVGDLFVHM